MGIKPFCGCGQILRLYVGVVNVMWGFVGVVKVLWPCGQGTKATCGCNLMWCVKSDICTHMSGIRIYAYS